MSQQNTYLKENYVKINGDRDNTFFLLYWTESLWESILTSVS